MKDNYYKSGYSDSKKYMEEIQSTLFDDRTTLNNESILKDDIEPGNHRILTEKNINNSTEKDNNIQGKEKITNNKNSRRYSYGNRNEYQESSSGKQHKKKSPLLRRLSDYLGSKPVVVNDKKMCLHYIHNVETQDRMNHHSGNPVCYNQISSKEKQKFDNYWLKDKQLDESDFETSDDEL